MKPVSEQGAGFKTPRPPSLEAVLARLERLSLKAEFALQRERALARALKPYLEGGTGGVVAPLPEETELAGLLLICDFYPEDGQLTLIEQLRDVITEHIPNDERAWLDPLKHSYLDLLELTAAPNPREALALRSVGDGTMFFVPFAECAKDFVAGQVLLTRVIRDPEAYDSGKAVWGGCGILLSPEEGKALYEAARDWERSLEMSSGSLVLGEWQEFAKRFGHILLWSFADLRVTALVDAVVHIRYRNPDGQPYLYAVALYDHHDYRLFAEGLSGMTEFHPREPVVRGEHSAEIGDLSPARIWIQRDAAGKTEDVVAKLTLTSSQLIVECDGPERLDRIKHRLASTFGFSLHFRGESAAPPVRKLSIAELTSGRPLSVVVTEEEDHALLNRFLEKAYLEWSDQPHRMLGGSTPRHAAARQATRGAVASLIDEMEQHDPGRSRTGTSAFRYNTLRAHVGLDEMPE